MTMVRKTPIALAAALITFPLLVGGALSEAATNDLPASSDAAQVQAAPAELRPYFVTAARTFALPPALLVAVAKVESGFNPRAVGPPTSYGPAQGLMQFLASSWPLFNVVAGATPFDPGPAVLAAANHLLRSGRLEGGGWDAAAALFDYNHSSDYVHTVLEQAAAFGYRYAPGAPPLDQARYAYPVNRDEVVACVRAEIIGLTRTAYGPDGRALTLRGEDGWRYHYAQLASLDPALSLGHIVETQQPLGSAGPAFTFAISHTGVLQGQIDATPYLELWRN